MKKTCTKCGTEYPATDEFFYRHKTGLRGECKACTKARIKAREKITPRKKRERREYQAEHYEKHKEKRRAGMRKYYAENKESFRDRWKANRTKTRRLRQLHAYGITLAELTELEASHGGKCGICAVETSDLVVDHDHATGAVRGLLCRACNGALAFAKEEPAILANAIAYLRRVPPSIVLNHDRPRPDALPREPVWRLDHKMRRHYGINLATYDAMVERVGGKCEICGISPSRLRVDHCHETGKIRGLLCHSCNSMLGFIRDTPEVATAMITYLRGGTVPCTFEDT